METAIHNEIMETVNKHLPSYVGEALTERLATLTGLQHTAEELSKKCALKDQQYEALESKLDEAHNRLEKHDDLDAREDTIRQREQAYSEAMLESAVNFHRARADEMKEIILAILRPATIRTQVQKQIAVDGGDMMTGSYDNDGRPIYAKAPGTTQDVTDTTDVTEE